MDVYTGVLLPGQLKLSNVTFRHHLKSSFAGKNTAVPTVSAERDSASN